jgi:hypothetical protein
VWASSTRTWPNSSNSMPVVTWVQRICTHWRSTWPPPGPTP